jgi:hypothetical protein
MLAAPHRHQGVTGRVCRHPLAAVIFGDDVIVIRHRHLDAVIGDLFEGVANLRGETLQTQKNPPFERVLCLSRDASGRPSGWRTPGITVNGDTVATSP